MFNVVLQAFVWFHLNFTHRMHLLLSPFLFVLFFFSKAEMDKEENTETDEMPYIHMEEKHF